MTNLRRWDGALLQRMTIARLLDEDKIPFMIEIALATEEGVKRIPLNDMRQIRILEGADPSSYQIIAEDLGDAHAARTVVRAVAR